MKTKFFTLFLALAASVGTAFSETINYIDGIAYVLDNYTMTAEVWQTGYGRDPYSGKIVIPKSVRYYDKSYSVTGIGKQAFSGCSALTSVTIPNSVTSIGEGAFGNCNGLTSITIPNSVTSISDCAFYGCSGLTSVTIPNSVTSIGERAFQRCTGLTSITIPNSVTSIGKYAFDGCYGLTSISIPNSVTSIEDGAFWSCAGLTSVTIGNGVTSIGSCAFLSCTSLKSVTIGKSVTSIRACAFERCTSLTSISIPNSVTSIGDYAFNECTALTSVTIGNGVTSMGRCAFEKCSSLTALTCYALVPPGIIEDLTHENGLSAIYVLAKSVDAYKTADGWTKYSDIILPIGATPTPTDDVKVEPSETAATIVWPSVSGAANYELVIKDKKGNVVCTLIFNEQGQLISIAYNAPGRRSLSQTQADGFSFTVTGLDSNTSYDLTITAKNSSGATLSQKNTSFKTSGVSVIDQISNNQLPMSNKVIRNGQLYILRDGKTYTVQGQEVR